MSTKTWLSLPYYKLAKNKLQTRIPSTRQLISWLNIGVFFLIFYQWHNVFFISDRKYKGFSVVRMEIGIWFQYLAAMYENDLPPELLTLVWTKQWTLFPVLECCSWIMVEMPSLQKYQSMNVSWNNLLYTESNRESFYPIKFRVGEPVLIWTIAQFGPPEHTSLCSS